MKKIKILYIDNTSRVGGAGRSLIVLLEHLDKSIFHPIVILPPGGPLIKELRNKGIEVVSFRLKLLTSSIIGSPLVLLWLFWFVKKRKIAIIHSNSIVALIWAGPLGMSTKTPVVCHVRDLIIRHDPWLKIISKINPRVRYIAISKIVKKLLIERGVSKKNISLIYNAVDTKVFKNKPSNIPLRQKWRLEDNIIVGMGSRVDSWKGHCDFLSAVKILEKDRRFAFVIAGDDSIGGHLNVLKKIKQHIKQKKLSDKILWLGFVNEMEKVLAAFDITVVPSTNEPFGRIVIESMAVGTPVIAYDSGGIPEIIQSGKSGILTNPNNPIGIVSAIRLLANDKNLYNRIVKQSLTAVNQRFSEKEHLRKIQKLYLDVLKGKGSIRQKSRLLFNL